MKIQAIKTGENVEVEKFYFKDLKNEFINTKVFKIPKTDFNDNYYRGVVACETYKKSRA